MTTFQIKMIAVITMVIDHVGLFFFPEHEILRYIGRIAFPLFAWLIANGAYHTHDIRAYLWRLLGLAYIAQVPFALANQQIGSPALYTNVVFTLFLGLLAIMFIKKTNNKWLWFLTTFAACCLSIIFFSDYGAAGVLSVVAFYLFYNNKLLTVISQIVIIGIMPRVIYFLETYTQTPLKDLYMDSRMEIYGLISLIFILLYNNKQGLKAKYLFYIFYPLQYVVIYFINLIK